MIIVSTKSWEGHFIISLSTLLALAQISSLEFRIQLNYENGHLFFRLVQGSIKRLKITPITRFSTLVGCGLLSFLTPGELKHLHWIWEWLVKYFWSKPNLPGLKLNLIFSGRQKDGSLLHSSLIRKGDDCLIKRCPETNSSTFEWNTETAEI